MEKEIKRIMCCCGQGLGSSMMVAMNVERALKTIGITGVSVEHTSINDITERSADLFVVGRDLAPVIEKYQTPKITLDRLMDMKEIEAKLREAFNK